MVHRLLAIGLFAACAGNGDADVPAAELPTAAELLTRIASCDVIGGKYQPDDATAATIDVCGTPGAVFWTSDLDVTCDGKASVTCNLQTDVTYQDQTTAVDSKGAPLDAAVLPYIVLPSLSMRFDFRNEGLAMGSVVAVIFQDRVELGVVGDTGPAAVIGEASYRMAELLGIDPDPSTGGVDAGVTYLAFTGPDAVLDVIEDHDEAVRVGIARARALVDSP